MIIFLILELICTRALASAVVSEDFSRRSVNLHPNFSLVATYYDLTKKKHTYKHSTKWGGSQFEIEIGPNVETVKPGEPWAFSLFSVKANL